MSARDRPARVKSTKSFSTAKRWALFRFALIPFALPRSLPWCRCWRPLLDGAGPESIGGGSSPTGIMRGGDRIPLRLIVIVAPFGFGGRRGSRPQGGERGLVLAGVWPRAGSAAGRLETLVLSVEGQVEVAALTVPALQVAKRHGVALVIAIGSQDEGVIGPILQFARLPKRRQVEPVAGVRRSALAVLGPADGGNDHDGGAGVGKLPKVIHRGVDGAPLVPVLTRWQQALDIVEQEQLSAKVISCCGHVR